MKEDMTNDTILKLRASTNQKTPRYREIKPRKNFYPQRTFQKFIKDREHNRKK